ncbi:MAG: peptide-methionine (R)-S-oxide reductase, partial [Porticoccaceae bacterium]|nr:peptide-methionine (R)-S-oxide reductase [Porticoccaceae bacterium]
MNRRKWIQQLSLGLIGLAGATKLWAFEKLELSKDQWRQRLTPSQYRIL